MTVVAPVRHVSSTLPSHSMYRPDIDGLRAIAVILVLIYHAFPERLSGGYVGVDVFFVISGYLITGILLRNRDAGSYSFADFYARRVRRIFPALILTLVVTAIIGWFVMTPPELAQLGKDIASSAAFIPNITTWQSSGYFDDVATTKPLLHLWSLGIEEQFYFVWPVFILLAPRRHRWLLGLTALTIAASFAIGLHLLTSDPAGAYFLPWSRAWELGIGALLAMSRPWWDRVGSDVLAQVRRTSPFIGLALIVAAAVSLDESSAFPGWWALLPTVGTGLIIVSKDSAVNHVLGSRSFVAVGLISYPLYLWHWPLISFSYIEAGGRPSNYVLIGALVLSFLLASLTFTAVERPLRRVSSRLVVSTSVGAMFLIGFLGFATYRADGFLSSEDDTIGNILAYNDYDPTGDGARVRLCWLNAKETFQDFSPECQTRSGEPGVVVWGDSHAGRLYVGVRQLLGQDANVGQFTRNSCPPVFGPESTQRENCQTSNQTIGDSFARMQPSTVVMFAHWSQYGGAYEPDSPAATELSETIESVASSGAGRVVVVGPAPKWGPSLPTAVYEDWSEQEEPRQLATHLPSKLFDEVVAADAGVRAVVEGTSAEYVSLIDLLCDDQVCRTSVPGSPETLMSWDYGHLTTEGALFVADQIDAGSWIEAPRHR